MARLDYLDNSIPPVHSVAKYISDIFFESSADDFSSSLFILPTRFAVRSVKFLVLDNLAKRGVESVMGFRIITPEIFFSQISQGANSANSFQESAAWYQSLAKNTDLSNLFKSRNPDSSDYLHLSEQLSSLRKDLAQAGKNFRDAVKIFSPFGDGDRWEDIAKLERYYLYALKSMRREPAETSPVEAVDVETWSSVYPDLKKTYLIGLPDAPSLLLRAVRQMEQRGVSVAAVVFADDKIVGAGLSDYFDEYGMPSKKWTHENMPLDESQIYVVDGVESQADLCAEAVKKYDAKDAARIVSVICNESDSAPALIDRLATGENPVEAYSPQGKPLSELGVGRFLQGLLKISRGANFTAVLDVLKNSFVLSKVSSQTESPAADIISSIEEVALARMPKNLGDLMRLKAPDDSSAMRAFVSAQKTARALDNLIFPKDAKNAADRFGKICENIFFQAEDSSWSFDGERRLVLEFLAGQISQIKSLSGNVFGFADILEIVLKNASDFRFAESKTENAVALLDWMEAFWTAQPHVFINDFNSGILPSKAKQNAFLPDSQRDGVGLPSAESRRARDAYMFYTLLRSRKNGGRVSCIVPRTRANGDAVCASELLFQCPQGGLAERVEKLFSSPQGFKVSPPIDKSRKFVVPYAELKEKKLSPSAIKMYLACPFRFYLRYVLKMNVNDYMRDELDALSVGTFMHKIWENFAASEFKDSGDEREIESVLSENFKTLAREIFGDDISGALSVQLASLEKSLPAYAAIQARRRRDGWKIKYAKELVIDDFKVGDFTIKMRIDRVDENDSGDVCIVDYKTFDNVESRKGVSVAESKHIKNKRSKTDNALVPTWVDLQLPLYLAAYSEKYKPQGKATCAYFIMSKNADDSGFDVWDILDGEINGEPMMKSAMDKALEVVEAIDGRNFEPADVPEIYDDYAKIFSFAEGDIADFKINGGKE